MKAEKTVSYQLRIETKDVKCMSGDYFDHKQPHLLPSATKLNRRSVESWASVTAHKLFAQTANIHSSQPYMVSF
jgi:hypothetical protein